MARRTIFNAAVSTKLVRAKATGATNPQAAAAAGVHPDTVKLWLHRGTLGQEPFASFRLAFRRAEKQWTQANVAALAKLMQEDAGGCE